MEQNRLNLFAHRCISKISDWFPRGALDAQDEDLSERVAADRELLQMQIALQMWLTSDLDIIKWALENEATTPPTPQPMTAK